MLFLTDVPFDKLDGLDDEKRRDRQGDRNEVFPPGKEAETEERLDGRHEQHEHEHDSGCHHGAEQVQIMSVPAREYRLRIGALVKRMDELRKRKHGKRHGHADPVIVQKPDKIRGQRRRADDEAVRADAHDEPAFEERARLHGRMLHDILAGGVYAERKRRERIRSKIDKQHVHREDGRFPVEERSEEEDQDLRDVARKEELNDLLDVAIHPSPLAHGVLDGGEIVVHEDRVRRALGNVGTCPHRDADIRRLERGRIVDAVARHGDHLARALKRLHDAKFIRRRNAREHRSGTHRRVQLLIRHLVKFGP